MRFALFGFPRSGTTWLAQCINSLPGCEIAHEPFYQATDPMLIRSWPDALAHYVADRLDPLPVAPALEHLADMVADWLVRLAPQKRGFKEVYAGWKIRTIMDGVRQADEDARAILIWRRFEGVLSSFQRREIFGWITQVWERTNERARPQERILFDAIAPTDEVSTLFAVWLAQNVADVEAVQEMGEQGLVLSHSELSDRNDAWERLSRHLGVKQIVSRQERKALRMPREKRRQDEVRNDTQLTRNRFGGWCDELRRRAVSVADQCEHPDVVRVLCEVW